MKTAISLFSGCGGDTLGLTRAGYKVIAFSEFNSAAVESHLANFPESELIQATPSPDIKKKDMINISYIQDAVFAKYRDRVDVIFAGFPCFVKDTIVLTNNGYKPIQDVTLEDKLMTHKGRFQPIVSLQHKHYNGPLYTLKAQGQKDIQCTYCHPFYIRYMGDDSVLSEPLWIRAADLDIDLKYGKKIYFAMIKSTITEIPEKSIEDGIYVWTPCENITWQNQTAGQPVYNFEVSEDNSYVIHNIVAHNCQGLSRAGKKKAEDPRNQMYLQFVRATANIRPKFIIGENVTGLLSMKSGPEPSDPLLIDLIIKAFKEIGYELIYKQHEATEFGVPQKRKRIILVGYDTHQVSALDPAQFWTNVAEEGKKLPRISQTSFITNSMEGAALIPQTSIPEHFATYAESVPQTATPQGKPHPYITLKIGENLLSCSKRDSPVHSEIINKHQPSKTIICTYDHQPRLLVGLIKPDGTSYARTLLPDELKQIQGFPADYNITGSHKEKVVQIGNAVPPPMIEAVVRALPVVAIPSTIIRFKRKAKASE